MRGESNAILMENGIDFAEFSPEALQCLPELPWTIPDVRSCLSICVKCSGCTIVLHTFTTCTCALWKLVCFVWT